MQRAVKYVTRHYFLYVCRKSASEREGRFFFRKQAVTKKAKIGFGSTAWSIYTNMPVPMRQHMLVDLVL